ATPRPHPPTPFPYTTLFRSLADVTIKQPASPLVSNVLAAPINDPNEIRRRLVEQVTGTVRWRESVAYMASQGVVMFFEIGAGKRSEEHTSELQSLRHLVCRL